MNTPDDQDKKEWERPSNWIAIVLLILLFLVLMFPIVRFWPW